ncbi:chemotaxis protein CheX [Sulfurimonas sp.]|uniref:chemotaxis protein CheX n=1 Tax=Sulfurimonas sp. TaxID=2022749 RepID=UPI0025FCCB86|nr:chemotaxis protein CheX [Sulfurimonas sp.]MDD5157124.1 chemotaxis protein CheX [Sulfurimonas sp.]
MFEKIIEASQNFCAHQIREPFEIHDNIIKTRTLIAYIDIETLQEIKHRVYIASNKEFIQKISNLFLEEDESDEETLVDMLLETLNLIVGSAKVIAEETNSNMYSMSTPYFKEESVFDIQYDKIKAIRIQGCEMLIAIKELS